MSEQKLAKLHKAMGASIGVDTRHLETTTMPATQSVGTAVPSLSYRQKPDLTMLGGPKHSSSVEAFAMSPRVGETSGL